MDQSKHEEVKVHFLNAVFFKDMQRLRIKLGNIQNLHALKYGCRAFILDGKPVWNGDTSAAKMGNKKPLDPEHRDEARRIIAAQDMMKIDIQRVRNFWGIFSRYCKDMQDHRNMIPDMVVDRMAYNEIQSLSRTEKASYYFSFSPSKQKLYQDSTNIIFRYLVNDLVF